MGARSVLGAPFDFVRDPLEFIERAAREHGDLVDIAMPGRPYLLLSHPDHVEVMLLHAADRVKRGRMGRQLADVFGQGLVVSEGDLWKSQRRMLQPAFHARRLQGYAAAIVDHARRASDAWAAGERRDIHRDMMALTLAIVGTTLFGADVRGDAPEVAAAVEVIIRRLMGVFSTGMRPPLWVPTPLNLRFRAALRRIDEIIYRVIAERRRAGAGGDDLLGTLLAAQDDEQRGMSDRRLRDELVSLFIAGHETTANALAFTLHLLGAHEEAAARVRAEVDEVLAGRDATAEDLARLRFTDAVVSESLRLFPPAWLIGREAREPIEIAGVRVPRGAQLLCSPWVIHRDERFFAAARSFRPERWLDGLASRLPRFAWFPFGGGPHTCIGNGFARMEAVLVVATIAQRIDLRPAAGTTLRPLPSTTLRPRNGLPMEVTRRA